MSDVAGTTDSQRLGDFEIVREIGRGGMGIVYKARQISLNRPVALKVLAGGLGITPTAVQRFRREAEAAAKLHHTNIVPVYAIAEENGTHFYAMELIDGSSLDQVVRQMRQGAQSRNAKSPDSGGKLQTTEWGTRQLDPTAPFVERPSPPGSKAELSSSSLSSGGNYFDAVAQRFAEVADALGYAHQHGVIHRDIKPSNLLLSPEGRLSVNDFGLARMLEQPGMTLTGEFVGTPAYMSPEQITAGRIPLDHRTDIYSLGATIYELLTLFPPFRGEHREQLLAQIIQKEAVPPRRLNEKVPVDLETICLKCLEKDPDRRYRTAGELAEDLRRYVKRFAISARRAGPVTKLVKFVRRHKLGVAAAAAIVLLFSAAAVAVWSYRVSQTNLAEQRGRAENEQWIRETAIPDIRRLLKEKDYGAAFEIAEEAELLVPGDPTLQALRPEFTSVWSLNTSPPGAEIYVKPYQATAEAAWRHVGLSPLEQISLPRGLVHWRVTKEGHTSVEGCGAPEDGPAQIVLDRKDDIPEGMVRVLGNRFRFNIFGLDGLELISLQDYFIDRYEVTNREFKKFVDQGGYQTREYWRHDFLKADQVLSWEEATQEFVDDTGQPGPSIWHSGTYPAGEDNYPVRGISWYEAEAYAAFAGKSLPTVIHWIRASGLHRVVELRDFQGGASRRNELDNVGEFLRFGNANSSGPVAVGFSQSLGPFGTYDMAGNVKEWCSNKAEGDMHYILGGSWNEPSYMFYFADAQASFNRSADHGFRCVKYLSDSIPATAQADMPLTHPRTGRETPVSDATFEIIKGLYAYDKLAPLDIKTLSREESAEWIHETVQFSAAYGDERITAHLYLPRSAKPPYQTVLHFPGAGSWDEPVFAGKEWKFSGMAELAKSGRAFLWPVYVGTFERRRALKPGWSFQRDNRLQLAKDLGRSLDYLEQRPDIDHSKIAYYGFSYGASLGNIHLAIEDRFQAAVLISGGLPTSKAPWPELDEANFAPRVKLPVLMLGGRSDPIFGLESSQKVMYELLGTPTNDKRLVTLDAGHILPQEIVNKEMVSWLDHYLGPVH